MLDSQITGHQGGPQMSENGEKIKAIHFPHLNNTLKLPKNTDLENIDSYSPQNMKPGHVLTVKIILSSSKSPLIIKHQFIIQPG